MTAKKQLKAHKKRCGRTLRSIEDIEHGIIQQLTEGYIVADNGCWLWQGMFFDNGYPRLRRHSARSAFHSRGHIASFQLHKGCVQKGLLVCHSCDVKACINPAHLWLGTHEENMKDGVRKGLFKAAWTPALRAEISRRQTGVGNSMYGKRGKDAPAAKRIGKLHPMFGKKHTEETKRKISENNARRRK